MPSLAQLDQAVREFLMENPSDIVIVVVDASFGHRIDPSELRTFEEAEAAGELVSPPAGAIGRGDAFLLRIADKTGATVLSNDSFQEFHGDYEWLFERGRLIGGKPVPGVGWIFTPRTPVRGPRSREAVKEAKRKTVEPVPTTPGLDLAAERGRGKGKQKKTVERAIAVALEEAVAPKDKPRRSRKDGAPPAEPVNDPLTFITFIAAYPLGASVSATVESFASHGAFVDCGGCRCYVPLSAMGDPPPKSAREVFTRGEQFTFVVQALDPLRRGVELAVPGFAKIAGSPTDETIEAEIGSVPAAASDALDSLASDSLASDSLASDSLASGATVSPAPVKRARTRKKAAPVAAAARVASLDPDPGPVPVLVPPALPAKAASSRRRVAETGASPVSSPAIERVESPAVESPAVGSPAVGSPAVESPALEPPALEPPALEPPAVESLPVESAAPAASGGAGPSAARHTRKRAPAKKAAAARVADVELAVAAEMPALAVPPSKASGRRTPARKPPVSPSTSPPPPDVPATAAQLAVGALDPPPKTPARKRTARATAAATASDTAAPAPAPATTPTSRSRRRATESSENAVSPAVEPPIRPRRAQAPASTSSPSSASPAVLAPVIPPVEPAPEAPPAVPAADLIGTSTGRPRRNPARTASVAKEPSPTIGRTPRRRSPSRTNPPAAAAAVPPGAHLGDAASAPGPGGPEPVPVPVPVPAARPEPAGREPSPLPVLAPAAGGAVVPPVSRRRGRSNGTEPAPPDPVPVPAQNVPATTAPSTTAPSSTAAATRRPRQPKAAEKPVEVDNTVEPPRRRRTTARKAVQSPDTATPTT